MTENRIDVNKIIKSVYDDAAGGIDVFIGTTRNNTASKSVVRLEFESHISMAVKELQKIIDDVNLRWPIIKTAVSHRVGVVPMGEEAVVVAVSSKHRADAFEACRYIIDTLKQTVPIWKKEIFEDGEVWVAAHP